MRWRGDGVGRGSRRRGTAALEFALILPVLMTIVFACVDFGRFPQTQMIVANAAREGAAVGSNGTALNRDQVQDAVKAEMGNLSGFDPSKLSVSITTAKLADKSKQVSVSVSYPFQTLVTWPGIPSSLTLQHVVVMRRLDS